MDISTIQERNHISEFLSRRWLTQQYKKAKQYILSWHIQQVHLKLRKPKTDGIYYFRINKQFRALCLIDGTTLKVFDIDNHQN